MHIAIGMIASMDLTEPGRAVPSWTFLTNHAHVLIAIDRDPELRQRVFPSSRLNGPANALVFANADAASGVRNILKMRASGLEVGPILMGMSNRAHIVSPSITARGLLNMAAIAGTPVAHYS